VTAFLAYLREMARTGATVARAATTRSATHGRTGAIDADPVHTLHVDGPEPSDLARTASSQAGFLEQAQRSSGRPEGRSCLA
jgi:hypothetical protein